MLWSIKKLHPKGKRKPSVIHSVTEWILSGLTSWEMQFHFGGCHRDLRSQKTSVWPTWLLMPCWDGFWAASGLCRQEGWEQHLPWTGRTHHHSWLESSYNTNVDKCDREVEQSPSWLLAGRASLHEEWQVFIHSASWPPGFVVWLTCSSRMDRILLVQWQKRTKEPFSSESCIHARIWKWEQ